MAETTSLIEEVGASAPVHVICATSIVRTSAARTGDTGISKNANRRIDICLLLLPETLTAEI